MKPILPVILSGGSGTRLWPLSRQSLPKQLLPLTGAESLLQQTIKRVRNFLPPLVIANEEHRFVIAEQLREINITPSHLVLEPCGRNTAPAAAIASLLAEPDALLLVLPADHHITDLEKFYGDIEVAAEAAAIGKIVTLGLKPTTPETGYGYLEMGAPLKEVKGAFSLASFTEKPERKRAESLLKGGKHLWNSGMFLFQAKTFIALLESLQPEILKLAKQAVATATRDLDFLRLDEKIFAAMPSISIDYAIMEHTANGALVPAQFGWCDLGAWDALWDIAAKDNAGNALLGNSVALHTKNSYVRSEGILTAVLGLEDVVVVTTADAVLVTHRSKAQQLRELVDVLKDKKELFTHRKVYRPWGHYEGLDSGNRFQVKRLFVKPGSKISLQKHLKRAEHWVVVEGTAFITLNEKEFDLHENESVHIPIGATHRIENKQKTPLTLIEVQTGAYLGEDDIVRFNDSYGRK